MVARHVSSHLLPGNHWSLLTVNLQAGSFHYFDSLCWPVPRNLRQLLERVIIAENKVSLIKLTIPDNISCTHPTIDTSHYCNGSCMINYPIQQCSNICGPVSILMATIFVNTPSYWQNVIQSTDRISSSWIGHPTPHSSYGRKLISWLMKQRVEMSDHGI